MKKITLLALLLLSLLCLGACSSKEEEKDNEKAEDIMTEEATTSIASIESIPEFKTHDLDGNEITNDIFAEKDLTVLNVWATFCGPCINEMSELAKWEEELPENVQIIGLLADVYTKDSEEYDLALKICEQTGVTYKSLILNSNFDPLIEQVVGVPTTFFVDSEGNVVGDPIVGAHVLEYQKFVKEYFK